MQARGAQTRFHAGLDAARRGWLARRRGLTSYRTLAPPTHERTPLRLTAWSR